MSEITYFLPMFERLQPRTPWQGGRVTDTDVLTLSEAASMATLHAGQAVSVGDFLRAAGRGEITLRAVIYRTAKVQSHDGGIYCNAGQDNENTAPAGAIPTLPLSACQHLAATGRASWRTFDGFEMLDGVLQRYTKGLLVAGEPDFETVADDCRVTGADVHALADAVKQVNDTQPQAAQEPAPVVEVPAKPPITPATSPTFTMTKAAMIEQHRHEWQSIEQDIKDAKRNGLGNAKAGARGWDEAKAMEWARVRGKLISINTTAQTLSGAINSMATLPTSRKHSLEG